jgi:hypothetical protein
VRSLALTARAHVEERERHRSGVGSSQPGRAVDHERALDRQARKRVGDEARASD